jgi:hypothetical protein
MGLARVALHSGIWGLHGSKFSRYSAYPEEGFPDYPVCMEDLFLQIFIYLSSEG